MDYGYIKLHRSSLDCDQFKDDWLWRLWCWCLLKANHQEGNFKGSIVPRGSFITGKLKAAEELGVTESKWWRGVDRLSKPPYACLHVSANNRWTMITVLEYETYQQTAVVLLPAANNQRTTSEQPAKPIEEQQEYSLSQPFAGRLVPRFDTPEVRALLPRWISHWPRVREGKRLGEDQLEAQLMDCARMNWDAPMLCASIIKSIGKDAKNLLPPNEDDVKAVSQPKQLSAPNPPKFRGAVR